MIDMMIHLSSHNNKQVILYNYINTTKKKNKKLKPEGRRYDEGGRKEE